MIYVINYCTDFMFLVIIVCVTHIHLRYCLINFNFPLAFKISLMFSEIYVYMLFLKNDISRK